MEEETSKQKHIRLLKQHCRVSMAMEAIEVVESSPGADPENKMRGSRYIIAISRWPWHADNVCACAVRPA